MTRASRYRLRRSIFCLAALAAFVELSNPVAAQEANFPTKSMRIVVPFPPGGYSDLLARVIGKGLSE